MVGSHERQLGVFIIPTRTELQLPHLALPHPPGNNLWRSFLLDVDVFKVHFEHKQWKSLYFLKFQKDFFNLSISLVIILYNQENSLGSV